MIKTSASSRWLLASATLAALAASAGTASANADTTPAATDTAAAATQDSGTALDSGQRAYIDPVTGKLRQATAAERAEEARASAKAQAKKGKGVRFVKRADGTVRAEDLDGRFMESAVVVRNPDGSLSYGFVTGDGTAPDPKAVGQAEDK